ncbi:hypothetical protein M422DRAFT_274471 [Sphaerobolus stellatus SS14]|uniref:Uncharacterized protein n=1 Tax=Sphaerobolus stellatus (strain SS14) TaxID=990650 RepID=A0A0C9UHJ4_SPHS4|nr:hypothetical protein M422DRAFT_274471 [Sphaerobolus stellatus SS14]
MSDAKTLPHTQQAFVGLRAHHLSCPTAGEIMTVPHNEHSHDIILDRERMPIVYRINPSQELLNAAAKFQEAIERLHAKFRPSTHTIPTLCRHNPGIVLSLDRAKGICDKCPACFPSTSPLTTTMSNVDSIPIIIGKKVKLTVDHQDYLWNRYIAKVLVATNGHEVLLGDICVVTANPPGFLNNENIPHDIYVCINNYAWKPLSDCHHSNVGKEKFAMHPIFGHKILFNLPRLLWQHKSNIQELVKQKQAASHPPSPS